MFSQSVTSLHFKELSSPEHQAAVLVMGTARGRLMVVLISPVSGAKLLTNYKLVERTAVSKVRLVDNHILALQVWPLTQIFMFPFCKNSLICLEGKSRTLHRGNTVLFRSSQQLPRLCLGPFYGF